MRGQKLPASPGGHGGVYSPRIAALLTLLEAFVEDKVVERRPKYSQNAFEMLRDGMATSISSANEVSTIVTARTMSAGVRLPRKRYASARASPQQRWSGKSTSVT